MTFLRGGSGGRLRARGGITAAGGRMPLWIRSGLGSPPDGHDHRRFLPRACRPAQRPCAVRIRRLPGRPGIRAREFWPKLGFSGRMLVSDRGIRAVRGDGRDRTNLTGPAHHRRHRDGQQEPSRGINNARPHAPCRGSANRTGQVPISQILCMNRSGRHRRAIRPALFVVETRGARLRPGGPHDVPYPQADRIHGRLARSLTRLGLSKDRCREAASSKWPCSDKVRNRRGDLRRWDLRWRPLRGARDGARTRDLRRDRPAL